jgi:hypothetical protein
VRDPPGDAAAREACDHALFIAVLLFLWGALSLLSDPSRPFLAPNFGQLVAGAAGIVTFSWKRDHRALAQVYTAVVVGYSLVILPWTAVTWCRLGRPWEALSVPQVGMLAMALVAPQRPWAGIALVAAFAAETAFAIAYARHLGLHARMPTTEPYLTLMVAVVGIYIVVLRRRRQQLVLGQIRLQAEAEALGRLEPLFASCRDEMDDSLGRIDAALQRSEPDLHRRGMARAVERIGDVRDRIGRLVAGENGTPEPAAGERSFIAADAHSGAVVLAASGASLGVFFITLAAEQEFPRTLIIIMLLLALACLAYLSHTRGRTPPRWQSAAAVMLLWAAVLAIATWGEQQLAHYAVPRHQPFTPFIPHKLLLVMVPLTAPALPWMTLLASLVTVADALVLHWRLHLTAHTDLVSLFEPWTTLGFALIGLLLMGLREQRLVASIGLMRAESRRAALERRAHVLLALRDQLNSPLQALVLYVAQGATRSPSGDPAMRAEVERLVALSRRLAVVDVPYGRLAFDPDDVLDRRRAGW